MVDKLWQRGDTIILRYALYERMTRVYQAARDDPVNVAGWPHVVVEDAGRVALYMPEGTPLFRWDVEDKRFRKPRMSQGDSIRLLYPGQCYDVSMFYETGSGPAPWVRYYFPQGCGRFYGWKVDLSAPFRRTALGFDVIDEVLDIVVRPDRSYYWKDEDLMARFIDLGIYTPDEARNLRRAGEAVIERIESQQSPFDDEWINWFPTPDLAISEMPRGWELLPLAD